MSLTSYRAAPPRVIRVFAGENSRAKTPWYVSVFDPAWWPGADRLSRVLRRSTIGAEVFHGRVRDGIGCGNLAVGTRPPGRIRGTDGGVDDFGVLVLREGVRVGAACGEGVTLMRQEV